MTVDLERYVAIDCEMVGCRTSQALARIAAVDHTGAVLYHSYVFTHHNHVKDYRTETSGISPGDLDGGKWPCVDISNSPAPTFEQVRAKVQALLKGKIVVGHALFNDLAALKYRHVYEDCRDTALFYPLRRRMNIVYEGQYPSLRSLTREVLGREIQQDQHSPIEDARATMALFLTVREEYEAGLANDEDVVAAVPSSAAQWYY